MNENGIKIVEVHGDTWQDIQENARRIAGIPNGTVTFSGSGGIHSSPSNKDGARYAHVTVTPSATPVVDDGRYSPEELSRAFAELYGSGNHAFYDNRLKDAYVQIKKNRAYNAQDT